MAEVSSPAVDSGLRPAFAAVRVRLGLVAALFVLAGVGWWWTARRMDGMDDGPWTDVGTFGSFLATWVVMMAAMMFPSVSPTVALYARMTGERSAWQPLLFGLGYLLTWTGSGVVAFTIITGLGRGSGRVLVWDDGGRWAAGATLVLAAAYQLTPLKEACLAKCRSPLGFLLGSWRDGPRGALQMGARHGGWCVGCCWALMAALFALGIMSTTWMAVVAGLIAIEKMVPWRAVAPLATAAVLLVIGSLVLVSPDAVPGLTTPRADMDDMGGMDG